MKMELFIVFFRENFSWIDPALIFGMPECKWTVFQDRQFGVRMRPNKIIAEQAVQIHRLGIQYFILIAVS